MNHYETLGVAKDATSDEIKKAYRKLASQHHPDRGGDTKKFQDVQGAYETLSDPDKRAEYDMIQAGGGRREFRFSHGGGGGFGGMDSGMADIFEHLRRQFNASNTGRQQRPPSNRDVRIGMHVKLIETLEEQKKIIKVNLPGKSPEELEIKIPRGIYHGAQIRYPGLGDHSVANAPRGDLYVQFLIEPDPNFEQVGIDLITVIPVNCIEAMTGCEKEVTGLDGKKFNIVVPAGSQYGSKFGINDQGLYSTDHPGRGRLIVALDIYIPTLLTPDQLSDLRNIQKTL